VALKGASFYKNLNRVKKHSDFAECIDSNFKYRKDFTTKARKIQIQMPLS
jgi:hypothetical protein